jgi:hypothetical protein
MEIIKKNKTVSFERIRPGTAFSILDDKGIEKIYFKTAENTAVDLVTGGVYSQERLENMSKNMESDGCVIYPGASLSLR